MTTAIVGAGIIGTALAHELGKRGREVVLIDPNAPGTGASFGNMASIAVTEFLPASRPSVWRQMPGWMLDPEGPVRVRPAHLPRLIPWFARFLAASRPSRLRALEAQGAALCARAHDDLEPLLRETGLSDHLSETGCLALYRDEAEFRADRDHLALLERFGFPHRILTGDEAREREPELSKAIGKAVLLPQNRTLRDPHALVTALAAGVEAMGGRIERAEVTGFERNGRITALRLADGRTLRAGECVLCAGAHTGRLSKLLGEPMPLETERGYSTQIMAPGITLGHALIWPARAFMVSPTAGGIRVGGTVEMAGLDAPPDFRRAKVTIRHAQTALPRLRIGEARQWMGHRPALPDTVPVISPSSRTKGVFYATGHGHLGVTLAATTARLLADLMTGATPPLDMTPYRIDRFRGGGAIRD